MVTLTPHDPLAAGFAAAIGTEVRGFLDRQRAGLEAISPDLADLADAADAYSSGGKRVRPACCAWGYVAAAGQPDDPGPLLRAAASLDLLHVSALVHDDVMDASDTRRGVPAAHRRFAAAHRDRAGRGDADAFGAAAAILLGDALLVWSEELFSASGFDAAALGRGRPVMEAMRTEVTAGQFLDVLAQSTEPLRARTDPEAVMARVHQVVEYKTARYTVVRPLQLGAALAGAGPDVLAALAGYGSALGRAFQYRDDVLGVFGDEARTGKPAGDDLREGKLTVLVAHAIALASEVDARRLARLLGDPGLDADAVDQAREIITTSGALAATEAEITAAHRRAVDGLAHAPVTPEAREALTVLARLVVEREA
ncbi:MAG TPA: polyprenyl synthetase family protein [Propionicimonas sp.]|nr:polyprenyl synthetase family protein [Propionicimonas sp.]